MENSNESKNSNEEIIIENRYNVTKKLAKQWLSENKIIAYFKIFWILITIYYFGMIIFCIMSNDMQYSVDYINDMRYSIDYVIFAFYAILFLFVNDIFLSREYNKRAKFYKKRNWERRIIFFDDYFEIIEENINSLKIQYSDILNIEKNTECIKLKTCIGYTRIYKNAFVKSNFEECEEFLNKKMSC